MWGERGRGSLFEGRRLRGREMKRQRQILGSVIATLLLVPAVATPQTQKMEVIFDNEFASVYRLARLSDFPPIIADCMSERDFVQLLVFSPIQNADRARVTASYAPAGRMYGCFGRPEATTYRIELKRLPSKTRNETDAVMIDPRHNSVLFQNSRIRVVSVHFGPGESGPIVDKRPRVIILLDDMHAVVTLPDGHSEPRDGKAGTVYWGNAGAQATKNVGDKAFENIVVELKGK